MQANNSKARTQCSGLAVVSVNGLLNSGRHRLPDHGHRQVTGLRCRRRRLLSVLGLPALAGLPAGWLELERDQCG